MVFLVLAKWYIELDSYDFIDKRMMNDVTLKWCKFLIKCVGLMWMPMPLMRYVGLLELLIWMNHKKKRHLWFLHFPPIKKNGNHELIWNTTHWWMPMSMKKRCETPPEALVVFFDSSLLLLQKMISKCAILLWRRTKN